MKVLITVIDDNGMVIEERKMCKPIAKHICKDGGLTVEYVVYQFTLCQNLTENPFGTGVTE